MAKDKMFSPSFCYILAANFLLFFAFYLILPILAFYLEEQFAADKTMIGVVLSCYTIACLCIRPFSGFLLDTFARRPLYLAAYFAFIAIFGGYILATTLTWFIALRILHGLAFGMVSVAGNTLVTYGEQDGRRLVSVILKGSPRQYFLDGKNLLEFGFGNFQNMDISGNETRYVTGQESVDINGASYQPEQLAIEPGKVITLPNTAAFSDAELSLEPVPDGARNAVRARTAAYAAGRDSVRRRLSPPGWGDKDAAPLRGRGNTR